MLKENKGITLIALVITIIVMLILVAVSVTVALEGGLFGTAKDAAIKTQAEADKEMLLSYVIGAVGEKAQVDFEKLDKSILGSEFEGSNGRYTKGDKTYLVDLNGNIEEMILPEGYKECKYIENTGTQYIDTGVKGASNIKIRLTGIFKYVNGGTYITGSRNGTFNQGKYNIIAMFSNPNYYDFQFDSYQYLDNLRTDNMTTLELSKNGAYINNELQAEVSQKEWKGDYNITIFAVNSGSVIEYGNGHSIYSYEIYENDILIRNFIPCLDENDRPCMYDTVSEQPFYNQGSGEEFLYKLK